MVVCLERQNERRMASNLGNCLADETCHQGRIKISEALHASKPFPVFCNDLFRVVVPKDEIIATGEKERK